MSIWSDKAGRRHVGIMVRGRRVHRIMPKGASASDARRVEAEIRGSIEKRGVAIPCDPPLSRIMSLFVEHADTLRSPETAKYHALRLEHWIVGRKASDALQCAQAMTLGMRKTYKPATINRTLGTLKKALSLAWEQGITPENYGARIKRLPEKNMRDVYLSIDQVRTLADAASTQVRAAIWIALYTGCRRGEILAMQAEDIGDKSILIRGANTKTLRTRSVPIIAPLRPWLKHIPLSVTFEGLKTGFRRARVKAELPHVTFHDLRRSCGTLMVQAGVDLYVVSKLLGHSSGPRSGPGRLGEGV